VVRDAAVAAAAAREGPAILRDVRRYRAEPIVDAAIHEGRIEQARREEWLRRFEQDPQMAVAVLGDLSPDSERAWANLHADPDLDQLWRAYAAHFGLDAEPAEARRDLASLSEEDAAFHALADRLGIPEGERA
jgi:hypothetical protein